MPSAPLQLGIILDPPLLLGPLILSFGLLLLMYWHLEQNVLRDRILPDAPATRHFLTFPFVVSTTCTIGAFAVYIDRVWFLALLLYGLGRIMEAAVAVRFFRRILHYISKALGGLGLLDIEPSGKSKRRQAREFVENRLWKIGIRLLIALLALLIAGGIFFYTLRMISASLSETLLIIWSTYIGISLGSLLIVKIRSSLVTLDPIAVLGIVVCVTGAELFHYPENTFPLARSIPLITEQQISVATSLLPGVTAWDAALIVFGQLAFVIGILVSMLFWSISNRQATV